ncbi:hypothetical protein [Aquibacillus sediminis]|uniref:hypothetical protein n=1 Tax=Aquibacillus sediminis TaxID=2574734 RepID=UPI0011097197|nr:hypothetical protein [Aquibacillus sediminis]
MDQHEDEYVRVPGTDHCKKVSKLAKKIKVQGFDDEDVSVENNSGLEMIGKGRQGAVFKLNDDVCMKIYGEIDDCNREYHAMMLGKKTDLLPDVYCKGTNFITMEMVYGVDLREYLQSQPLTKELSFKLIELLQTFKKIGYERIDHHKRQIFLQDDGSLKVIDVGRTIWRNRTYPYPRKLLKSLGPTTSEVFLSHVKEVAPELHDEWRNYMEMDEKARELTKKVMEEIEVKPKKIKTKKMLTSDKENTYNYHLEQLVRKVVKEERELVEQKVQQLAYMMESVKKMEAIEEMEEEDLPTPPYERILPYQEEDFKQLVDDMEQELGLLESENNEEQKDVAKAESQSEDQEGDNEIQMDDHPINRGDEETQADNQSKDNGNDKTQEDNQSADKGNDTEQIEFHPINQGNDQTEMDATVGDNNSAHQEKEKNELTEEFEVTEESAEAPSQENIKESEKQLTAEDEQLAESTNHQSVDSENRDENKKNIPNMSDDLAEPNDTNELTTSEETGEQEMENSNNSRPSDEQEEQDSTPSQQQENEQELMKDPFYALREKKKQRKKEKQLDQESMEEGKKKGEKKKDKKKNKKKQKEASPDDQQPTKSKKGEKSTLDQAFEQKRQEKGPSNKKRPDTNRKRSRRVRRKRS